MKYQIALPFSQPFEQQFSLLLDILAIQGRKVKVSHTQPKNRLFIGNVPKHWDSDELESILKKEGPGILSVELMKVISLIHFETNDSMS